MLRFSAASRSASKKRKKYEKDGLREIAVQKPEFYPRGAKCYACIATGETALYANVILKKGVVHA